VIQTAALSPGDAIRAATINAAKVLGIRDSVGRISKGMSADLIAVDGDPLRDVSVLARVKHVMLRDRLIRFLGFDNLTVKEMYYTLRLGFVT
jgi:imidazolonepropionase-like amidohydrolase